MHNRKATVMIWGAAAAITGLLVVVLAPPLAKVWRCYQLANSADRETGTVIGKHESVGLVFAFGTGPSASDACTAKASPAVYEAAVVGDTFEVVRKPGRSSECYLTSSLALSGLILAGLSSVSIAFVLLVVVLAVIVQRSFATAPSLTSEFSDAEIEDAFCPGCGTAMNAGYIVPFAGIHWRGAGEPIGLPTALGGLPSTVGWRGRPCLQAFHCDGCGVVTFKYAIPALVQAQA